MEIVRIPTRDWYGNQVLFTNLVWNPNQIDVISLKAQNAHPDNRLTLSVSLYNLHIYLYRLYGLNLSPCISTFMCRENIDYYGHYMYYIAERDQRECRETYADNLYANCYDSGGYSWLNSLSALNEKKYTRAFDQ